MRKCGLKTCAFLLSFIMTVVLLPLNVFAEEQSIYDYDVEFYYGRNALSKMENGENLVAAYDAIGEAIKNGKSRVSIADYNIPYSRDMAYLLVDTYNKDHPEDYLLAKTYTYGRTVKNGEAYLSNVTLQYYTGYNHYLFNRMANRLLDAVKDIDNDYDKALTLYNMLEVYVQYDYDALGVDPTDSEGMMAYSAYGAIVNGKAVCEGYSEAYQYLLQKLGIQSYIVTGSNKKGELHEWNLLRLDGNYYYADTTWDDSGRVDEIFHNYFNITTARLLEGHIIDDPYGMLPDCFSTEMAYNYENVFTSYDVDAIAKIFKGDKKKTANLYFAGETDNFSTWWQANYSNVFSKISGLTPGTSYSIFAKAIGREHIVTLTPAGFGATVGGKVLSWGDTAEKTTVELFAFGTETPIYTAVLDGNFNYWYIDDVKSGSYILRVSKADHKIKECEFEVSGEAVVVDTNVFLVGDATEDGVLDVRDFARAKICIANGEQTEACDVNGDDTVDALDLVTIIDRLLSA